MNNNLKYDLTRKSIYINDKKLFRIRALRTFSDVKIGDLGGYIMSEDNLSHEGDCWVYDNAKVYDDAKITNNAKICDEAKIYKYAKIAGDAKVSDNAQVYDNAWIFDSARVYDNAKIFEKAWVYGMSCINGNAQVYGNAKVYGDSVISENSCVFEKAVIYAEALIAGDAQIYGKARVGGDSWIFGDKWQITPFYLELSKHSVISCSYKHIKIGCELYTIKEWKKLGKKIGEIYNLSDEEIKLYKNALLLAEQYIEIAKKGV